MSPAEPRFRRSSWTDPFSTRSSASSPTASASARSSRRCPTPAPASRSPLFRSCWPRSTRSSRARSSCSRPRTPTRATPPRPRAGSSATSASRSCPAGACSWGSGLEPPPHLVGERARALDVLAAAGSSARPPPRWPKALPPPEARPETIRVAPGDEPGIDALAEQLALAGYERVDRVEERGQFARAGRDHRRLPDDGPRAAAHRALRRRDRGDPRLLALHPARAAPGRRRRPSIRRPSAGSTSSSRASQTTRARHRPFRPTSWCRSTARPTSSGSPAKSRRSGRRRARARRRSTARPSSTRCRAGQPFAFEAQRPALAARGLAEAENELRALVRAGLRVVVAFPHRGEALRTQNLLRRVEARMLEPGDELPDGRSSSFAVRRARRGFVWRELGLALLPDTQVFRRRPRGRRRPSAARCSRSPTCAPATTSSTRTTASASCSASRRRRSPASRATTCWSPSAARTACTSRTSRSARSRATSAPTPARRRSPSSAARPGQLSRPARARASASWPAS